jgi:hypothetical protein
MRRGALHPSGQPCGRPNPGNACSGIKNKFRDLRLAETDLGDNDCHWHVKGQPGDEEQGAKKNAQSHKTILAQPDGTFKAA